MKVSSVSYENIYTQFTNDKPNRPDNLNLRLHRALSWLQKAENSQDDLDIQFISLWVSFNAIYARELGTHSSDRYNFVEFLRHVCQLDKDKNIYQLIWQKFSQSIRTMLNNRYVFQPFWDHHNGKISQAAWQEDFTKSNKKAYQALSNKDTDAMMIVIFDRLYTLRNQIVHGGATYDSSINRKQLQDACQILKSIIPIVIQIILDNPHRNWGKPFYPVVID